MAPTNSKHPRGVLELKPVVSGSGRDVMHISSKLIDTSESHRERDGFSMYTDMSVTKTVVHRITYNFSVKTTINRGDLYLSYLCRNVQNNRSTLGLTMRYIQPIQGSRCGLATSATTRDRPAIAHATVTRSTPPSSTGTRVSSPVSRVRLRRSHAANHRRFVR